MRRCRMSFGLGRTYETAAGYAHFHMVRRCAGAAVACGAEDIFALSLLPLHHCDPFDRLIIAQARRGGFQLVICDPEIAKYDADVLW